MPGGPRPAFDLSGVGGFNPHWLKMTPTLVTENFLSGSSASTPLPVPIQQDQHNVQIISKYGTVRYSGQGLSGAPAPLV